jgi:hypothetical protein
MPGIVPHTPEDATAKDNSPSGGATSRAHHLEKLLAAEDLNLTRIIHEFRRIALLPPPVSTEAERKCSTLQNVTGKLADHIEDLQTFIRPLPHPT